MILFLIVQAIYLPSRVTGQEKVQISAGPNTNQYPLASLCKSSRKPSTRFPLGRHVELKASPNLFFIFSLNRVKILTFYLFDIFVEI